MAETTELEVFLVFERGEIRDKDYLDSSYELPA